METSEETFAPTASAQDFWVGVAKQMVEQNSDSVLIKINRDEPLHFRITVITEEEYNNE